MEEIKVKVDFLQQDKSLKTEFILLSELNSHKDNSQQLYGKDYKFGLKPVYRTNLYSIELPDGITELDDLAFYNCKFLTSVKFPKDLEKIGDSVFEKCKNFQTVELPEALQEIGWNSFYDLNHTTKVKIPENVFNFYPNCFGYANLIIEPNNKFLTQLKNGIIVQTSYNLKKSIKWIPFDIVNVTIPSDIDFIQEAACFDRENLKSVKFLSDYTEISEYAFAMCENLQSIQLPKKLKKIDRCILGMCKALRNIQIPETVTSIESLAFDSCDNVLKLNIPQSVKEISKFAFNDWEDDQVVILKSKELLDSKAIWLKDSKAKIVVLDN